jgi:hypothetical protein
MARMLATAKGNPMGLFRNCVLNELEMLELHRRPKGCRTLHHGRAGSDVTGCAGLQCAQPALAAAREPPLANMVDDVGVVGRQCVE